MCTTVGWFADGLLDHCRAAELVEPLDALDRALDDRKLDPERAAAPDRALHVERAAHRLGEPARERQPDARPLDVGALGAEPLERREQQAEVLTGDARAGVGDLHAQPAAAAGARS